MPNEDNAPAHVTDLGLHDAGQLAVVAWMRRT